MTNLEIVMVPKELYYHEVKYVRGLETEIERLRTALADIRELVEEYADADDGQPNLAMRVLGLAEAVLGLDEEEATR